MYPSATRGRAPAPSASEVPMGIRIADQWFERKRIDDDITLLLESHVDPLLRCNIWHVRGRDRDAMIDTGLGICSLREAAHDLLEKPVVAVARKRIMVNAVRCVDLGWVCCSYGSANCGE